MAHDPEQGGSRLDALVTAVRTSAGWRSKQHIGVVGDVFGAPDWRRGPGDDGAVVDADGTSLIVCGEAILPAFLERDPFGAGIAAVLTNVNDVAAMGAVPLAVVDTARGRRGHVPDRARGMRHASALYDVPVVGGHLTIDPVRRALSAFALGRCPGPPCRPPRSARDTASAARVPRGRMRSDFPFFPSLRRARRPAGGRRSPAGRLGRARRRAPRPRT